MPKRGLTSYGPSIVVLLTAAVVLLAGPYAVRNITFAHTTARVEQASHRLTQADNILAQLNQAYRDIAAAVEPSVVHISAQRPAFTGASIDPARRGPRMAISSGSGWIYDDQGHVVTNYHVVEGATDIDVQLYTGEIRSAQLIGFDQTTDIAVLQIASGRLLPAIRANISSGLDEVHQGDIVFAFGSPFDFRFSMSSGIVSGKGRYVGIISRQFGSRSMGYENFIQTDAAINPGNSGGPLTDFRGRVIGMNTAIATANPRRSQDGRVDEGQFGGVGLAIPLEMIEPVVSQIITNGTVEKGYLGIVVLDRTDPLLEELRNMGFSEGSGVPVARVPSSAVELGIALQPGDVITHVDREPVYTPEQILSRALPQAKEGQPSELTIWRFEPSLNHGVRMRLEVTEESVDELRGISFLEYDTPILRRLEQLGFAGHGVLIVRVQDGAPAGPAGLRAFDVITHVNGQPIAARSQLQSMISSMLPDQVARLRIWRFDPEVSAGTTHDIEVQLARLDLPLIAGVAPPSPMPREDSDAIDIVSPSQRELLAEWGLIDVATATPEDTAAQRNGFLEGVVVHEIENGSPLDGLVPPGSVIVSVGDRQVRSVEQLAASINLARRSGQPRLSLAFRDPAGNFTTIWLGLN